MRIQKKSFTTDTIIAVAATIASVCALVLSVYQTVLTREQQLNSVWPYLISYTGIDDDGKATIQVVNNGVGPAIVESISVQYKGKPYKNMIEVIQTISNQLGRGPTGITWTHTEIRKGFVIPQGQTVSWLSAYNSSDYTIFRKELTNVRAVIHYKSIYDEHWRSNFQSDKEDAVVKE